MHPPTPWYVAQIGASFGIFRNHMIDARTTYIEAFRLQNKQALFADARYANRAADHINNMPTGARV